MLESVRILESTLYNMSGDECLAITMKVDAVCVQLKVNGKVLAVRKDDIRYMLTEMSYIMEDA